jgi:hypothetical protein
MLYTLHWKLYIYILSPRSNFLHKNCRNVNKILGEQLNASESWRKHSIYIPSVRSIEVKTTYTCTTIKNSPSVRCSQSEQFSNRYDTRREGTSSQESERGKLRPPAERARRPHPPLSLSSSSSLSFAPSSRRVIRGTRCPHPPSDRTPRERPVLCPAVPAILMALEAGSSGCGGRGWGGGFRSLMRRKQVDSDRIRAEGQRQLAKELNVPELVAIGAVSSSL